jgi:hypothetical protein
MPSVLCRIPSISPDMISLKFWQLNLLGLFPLTQHTTVEKLLINIIDKTYIENCQTFIWFYEFRFGVFDFRVGANDVSVLLGYGAASLGIWFPSFPETALVSWILLGYFDDGNQIPSDSASYPRRTNISLFLSLYMAGINTSPARYYCTGPRFMSECLGPCTDTTLPYVKSAVILLSSLAILRYTRFKTTCHTPAICGGNFRYHKAKTKRAAKLSRL